VGRDSLSLFFRHLKQSDAAGSGSFDRVAEEAVDAFRSTPEKRVFNLIAA
jgi:hypothetical protein